MKKKTSLKVTTYTRVLDRGSKIHGYPRIVAKITTVELCW